MPDETDELPFVNVRLGLKEVELLWALCYAVALGQIQAHAEYLRVAKTLEPFLHKQMKEMLPSWESPLKLPLN
jgi:hypothetical protein